MNDTQITINKVLKKQFMNSDSNINQNYSIRSIRVINQDIKIKRRLLFNIFIGQLNFEVSAARFQRITNRLKLAPIKQVLNEDVQNNPKPFNLIRYL